ncbi:MAG: hypothetical protein HYV26_01650 [Candidatus Hydrogenedentes bacterium]|nr:hypothetical protein [Candidatus Hydrogenedentota bacterium]
MGTSTNPTGGKRLAEHLDADAVCAQCGTVNPEETLICKVCGNNLRDQRQMRLAAEAQLDGEAPGRDRRLWLSRGLAVLGLLVVLWTMLNVDKIQQWMINAQVETVNPAEDLFFGAQSGAFDDLATELRANLPTAAQAQAAASSPTMTSDFEGYYVVPREAGGFGSVLVRIVPEEKAENSAGAGPAEGSPEAAPGAEAGTVAAGPAPELKATTLRFVALFADGEVRGTGELRGNSFSADWNSVGARSGEEYTSASGAVIQQSDGTFDGFCQSAFTEAGLPFTMYKVPAS